MPGMPGGMQRGGVAVIPHLGFYGPRADCEPDRFERDPTQAEQQRRADEYRRGQAKRSRPDERVWVEPSDEIPEGA